MTATTIGGSRCHGTMRRVGVRAIGAAALLAAILVSPVTAHDSSVSVVIGDDGVARPGTYTPDAPPAWKARLLVLYGEMRANRMTQAEADELNEIVAVHVPDPEHRISKVVASPSGATAAAPATTSITQQLSGTQRPQLQANWCGPATAQSIILSWSIEEQWQTSSRLDGKALTQANLALSTYTNAGASGGTDWVDKDMQRALNNWLAGGASTYFQISPTSVSHLESLVYVDISIHWMMGADMIEVVNGLHYNYHPNFNVRHWTSIYGHSDDNATFGFQDPAAKTTVLGSDWKSVQQYFSMSSTSTYNYMMKNGVAARGVVW